MTAGITGVPLGSYLSTKLSKQYPRSDPVICAVGLLLSAPLIAASMIFVTYSAPLAYTFVFLGELALNLNWAIVADMLLVRTFLLLLSFYLSMGVCYQGICQHQLITVLNILKHD